MFECFFCRTQYEVHVPLCFSCGLEGLVGPLRYVPPSQLAAMPEIASAREIAKRDYEVISSPAYPSLHFGAGSFAILHGPPGGGKSTMATLMIRGQSAVYLSAEEGLGGALAERLKRLHLRDEKALFVGRLTVNQLIEIVSKHKPAWLVIDSIQMTTFSPGEIRRLSNVLPVKVIVGISQETKSGVARGSLAWIHEADAVIRVDELRWQIEKSRYQAPITGSVFEKTDNNGENDV